MWSFIITGFVSGFIIGLGVNGFLLRNVPREHYLNNKNMRMKYGLMNWGFALLGVVIAVYLAKTNL